MKSGRIRSFSARLPDRLADSHCATTQPAYVLAECDGRQFDSFAKRQLRVKHRPDLAERELTQPAERPHAGGLEGHEREGRASSPLFSTR